MAIKKIRRKENDGPPWINEVVRHFSAPFHIDGETEDRVRVGVKVGLDENVLYTLTANFTRAEGSKVELFVQAAYPGHFPGYVWHGGFNFNDNCECPPGYTCPIQRVNQKFDNEDVFVVAFFKWKNDPHTNWQCCEPGASEWGSPPQRRYVGMDFYAPDRSKVNLTITKESRATLRATKKTKSVRAGR